MLLFKTLAISTMATLSPLGGHVGPGLAAATAAVAEDWKDGGSVSARFRERRTIYKVNVELTHSFGFSRSLALSLPRMVIDMTPSKTRCRLPMKPRYGSGRSGRCRGLEG